MVHITTHAVSLACDLTLGSVLVPCEAEKELYGTTSFLVDRERLLQALNDDWESRLGTRPYTMDSEQLAAAAYIIEQRLKNLIARQG